MEVDDVRRRRLHPAVRAGDEEDEAHRRRHRQPRGEGRPRSPGPEPRTRPSHTSASGAHQRQGDRREKVAPVGLELAEDARRDRGAEERGVEVEVRGVGAVKVDLPPQRQRRQGDQQRRRHPAQRAAPRRGHVEEQPPEHAALDHGRRVARGVAGPSVTSRSPRMRASRRTTSRAGASSSQGATRRRQRAIARRRRRRAQRAPAGRRDGVDRVILRGHGGADRDSNPRWGPDGERVTESGGRLTRRAPRGKGPSERSPRGRRRRDRKGRPLP